MQFSGSGIYQLPALTANALDRKDPQYASYLLGWLQEAVIEGDAINSSDPNYDKIAKALAYVAGDQQPAPDMPPFPQYLQPMVFNFARKAMQAHVSALTDVKPTFGWRSLNPKFEMSAHQLNLLTIAWWLNQAADVKFGDVVKMAWTAGTADMMVEWNPGLSYGGDHDVIPKDPRDTLPWRPTRYGDEQSWEGVIFREIWSVNALRAKYPYYASAIQATDDSLLGSVKGLFFRKPAQFQTPSDPLSNLGGGSRMAGPPRSGDCVLYRCYLTDRTRNLTSHPIVMGDGSFRYQVEHGQYLYPYKRLIIFTQDLGLWDGPNPYWHGRFPFARLHLWKLPWMFLGQSALSDLMPVQDAINLSAKHMKMGIEQWMDRQVVLDKNLVSEATAKAYDSRKPGFTFKLKSTAVDPSKVVTKLDGPNPQVLAQNFAWHQNLIQTFSNLSGTANLELLLQMRAQLPAADTLEKYNELLTPELRMEGRQFEGFLRRCSTQICYNTFQFMDSSKRIAILGDAGALLEDFDFEPESLVPALDRMMPGPPQLDPMTGQPMPTQAPNPEYDPQFDRSVPRGERAQRLAKLMVFVVAPNSVLALNSQAEQMKAFQMSRMGYMDIWTLAERLEIPNFGAPPPMPLPPLKPLPPEVMADPLAMIAFLQSHPGQDVPGPNGEILEIRMPITVIERLQAQMMLGVGMTENPAGRKASGSEPPKQESKDGGERSTITESKK